MTSVAAPAVPNGAAQTPNTFQRATIRFARGETIVTIRAGTRRVDPTICADACSVGPARRMRRKRSSPQKAPPDQHCRRHNPISRKAQSRSHLSCHAGKVQEVPQ